MSDSSRIEHTTSMTNATTAPPETPIQLIGEHAYRYARFAKAAAELKLTGEAHQKAQEEYKQALMLLSASAEAYAKGQ